MTALEQYIQSYFGVASPEGLTAMMPLFTPTAVKKGTRLLQTGNRCRTLSFVQSGFLRVFAVENGREVTQWISTQGYFITDLASFIFNSPARWTIEAITDAELYTITQTDYAKIETLVTQWPRLEKLFLVRCFTVLENRIFSHLSMPAEERYHFFFGQHPELFNQVPLQYIASMLGMTPETFSRIRKKQL
jgi:CRP/FNR family transcriptional regulator, anaerobic regulatory protein